MVFDPASAHPVPGRMIDTDLGALFATLHGSDGPVLVLWPSIFTDQSIYDGLVARLAATHRLLLIDGPGHGRSRGPVQGFTAAQAARAMAQVMDAHGIDRAVVGGTSWGGLVGAEFAMLTPERAQAVVLMNTPMTLGKGQASLSTRMIAWGARWMPRWGLFRNGVAGSFFSAPALAGNPGYAARFHAMLRGADPRRLAAAVRSVLLDGAPLMPRLPRIAAPVLIIAGTEDAMYPLDTQAQAALTLPDAQFEPVGGKHISVIEVPDRVAELLAGFVAQRVRP